MCIVYVQEKRNHASSSKSPVTFLNHSEASDVYEVAELAESESVSENKVSECIDGTDTSRVELGEGSGPLESCVRGITEESSES